MRKKGILIAFFFSSIGMLLENQISRLYQTRKSNLVFSLLHFPIFSFPRAGYLSGPAQKWLHNYVSSFVMTNNPCMRNEEILFRKQNFLFSLAPFRYSENLSLYNKAWKNGQETFCWRWIEEHLKFLKCFSNSRLPFSLRAWPQKSMR